ncbi:hypothetical protein GT021_33730 [Streptomyces sp. SID5470]|uniref:Glyoxalase-like domain-containing protein n=1 Tax=Streptomyces sviceus (strain ATCC 29083 / DSM 924 / JCM 4929 / NBRC 13980 / NCIMB 11184 / NRRL 5439 / UC 5370) TaxID=463191 RepID=B5HRC1_STRX2|nr:conserved hypothetical protein [Streptomyces sviceus ATCC 29083]MYT09257.1 hypothetical protein [Streptomyces sp. SID5470]
MGWRTTVSPERTPRSASRPSGRQTVKNCLHFDLQPQDRTRDKEVDRLLALGATIVDAQRTGDGMGWVVLVDPEGNEFCEERRAAERKH